MPNIIDYVENQFETFEQRPFCRVDSLVLSELVYPKYDGIFNSFNASDRSSSAHSVNSFVQNMLVSLRSRKKPSFLKVKFKDLLKAEYFSEAFGESLDPPSPKKLLYAAAASPRFRDIELCFYVSEFDPKIEKQFAAMTYLINEQSAYVAFRGTDATIVGMKEDFNMAYICPVPAQTAAVKYLETVSPFLPPEILVGGHSKGGNLAVYSAFMCNDETENRIKFIFSHDGPGFRREVVESDEFIKIKNKIQKTVPQDAIVGLLLQNHEDHQVIKSTEKLLLAHDPFSWEVNGTDFVNVGSVSTAAVFADKALEQWIENMSDSKRMLFVDELFKIIKASNEKSFGDIKKNWRSAIPAMIAAIKNMDGATKVIMLNIINDLAVISWNNIT